MTMTKRRTAIWARGRAWALGSVALFTALACGQTNTTESGETHFLLTCESESCAEGFECLCGACSRPCDDDAACSGLGSSIRCVEHDDSRCKTVIKACDGACERDADCKELGSDYTCRSGFCRAGAVLPDPPPPVPRACDGGCGEAECAAPGACSLESACALVDCGGLLVDDNACVRPSCDVDGDCPAEERCTSLWSGHRTACTESNDKCDCEAGLGLYPVHVCSPVSLSGTRGTWLSLALNRDGEAGYIAYTVYPDGQLVRVTRTEAEAPIETTFQLSTPDLEQVERTVNGPELRLALVDATPCGSVLDFGAKVTLELDTTTLQKDVSGCVESDPGGVYGQLLQLVDRY